MEIWWSKSRAHTAADLARFLLLASLRPMCYRQHILARFGYRPLCFRSAVLVGGKRTLLTWHHRETNKHQKQTELKHPPRNTSCTAWHIKRAEAGIVLIVDISEGINGAVTGDEVNGVSYMLYADDLSLTTHDP
eukprot:1145582-Pelagomonas_calceolata.AAC.1